MNRRPRRREEASSPSVCAVEFLRSEIPQMMSLRAHNLFEVGIGGRGVTPRVDRDRRQRHLFRGGGVEFSGFGFRGSGFRFRVLGFGFRISGFGLRVLSSSPRVWASRFFIRFFGRRVDCVGFGVESLSI